MVCIIDHIRSEIMQGVPIDRRRCCERTTQSNLLKTRLSVSISRFSGQEFRAEVDILAGGGFRCPGFGFGVGIGTREFKTSSTILLTMLMDCWYDSRSYFARLSSISGKLRHSLLIFFEFFKIKIEFPFLISY